MKDGYRPSDKIGTDGQKMAHRLLRVSSEPTICVYISSVSHNVSRMNADVQEVNAS